ncbi:ABC transporter substrate-binding protein [Pseudonocardia spinosispora]|uniref:ABC transporter substrate-binding protein n=1 Tax=Pseudonocardia spinosispora TaxID=103441 RepID=UPI000421DBBD|nr:ABC transporter substrate-binding protein [Pseudonocardia spinosispora]
MIRSALVLLCVLLTGCAQAPAPPRGESVTVTNCGAPAAFPVRPRLFVNDGSMIATVLALGADDRIVAVSSLTPDRTELRRRLGERVDRLREVAPTYPSSLENVLASRPTMMFAGWGGGYSESKGITPARLARHGVAGYVRSDSCLRSEGGKRGTMDPWVAVRTDVQNLGAVLERREQATQVVGDLDRRLDALRADRLPGPAPSIFVYNLGTDAPVTGGHFGSVQGIIDAAGGQNIFADADTSWLTGSWERVIGRDPDVIVLLDRPDRPVAAKEQYLRADPRLRTLRAVRENRLVTMPYVLWTSGVLNIDAAEELHAVLPR